MTNQLRKNQLHKTFITLLLSNYPQPCICTSMMTEEDQEHTVGQQSRVDKMQLTSFSSIEQLAELELEQSEQSPKDLLFSSPDDRDSEVYTERFLYTIVEEMEQTRREDPESCSVDLKGAGQETTSMEPLSPVLITQNIVESPDQCNVVETLPSSELRMFPNITDDEKKVGTIYSTFYLKQMTKHQAVQCDIMHNAECQNCSLLTGEISRISKLLKKAEAEINYLNDEFRIMNEEKRCEVGCKNSKVESDSTTSTLNSQLLNHNEESQTIYCFAKWTVLGIWGMARVALERLFPEDSETSESKG